MNASELNSAIEIFMRPTPYTGVKPTLLVAEELATQRSVGQVVEAVWVGINSHQEFKYISKFAVSGKIVLGKYYKKEEMEPFRGRLALVNKSNLENVVLHKNAIKEIEELKAKRALLLNEIEKNFDDLLDSSFQDRELYLFKKKEGDWTEELFSDFDINNPYEFLSIKKGLRGLFVSLKNIKTGQTSKQLKIDEFYGYFLGSKADIAGLKLKSESYLQSIIALENVAKQFMKKIEWLALDDVEIKNISDKLSKHPFENYFHYVEKENIRDVEVSSELVDTLKRIILKHMPENDTPLGMEYIAIDKLLYLFHMIIPRDEALLALDECDVVYEAPTILLGHGGERKLPPKYLVAITHVAKAYQQFPEFMSVCENFTD